MPSVYGVTHPGEQQLKVLVPDDLGLELPARTTTIETAFYRPGAPMPNS